jgi:hypothetical protein
MKLDGLEIYFMKNKKNYIIPLIGPVYTKINHECNNEVYQYINICNMIEDHINLDIIYNISMDIYNSLIDKNFVIDWETMAFVDEENKFIKEL